MVSIDYILEREGKLPKSNFKFASTLMYNFTKYKFLMFR